MKKRIAVVGGGITGLIIADRITDLENKDFEVTLFEHESTCGGLLRSFDYGKYGKFDYGTHIMSETLDSGFDDYLKSLLPREEWNFLIDERRDLSGLFFNDRLQINTPFPDLRHIDAELLTACQNEFLQNLSNCTYKNTNNLKDFLESMYGQSIANKVLGPVIESFWGLPTDKLTCLAGRLIPVGQVCLFDDYPSSDLKDSEEYNWRLITKDQREVHLKKQCFYPRTPGIDQVVNSILSKLKDKGVSVYCSAKIKKISKEENQAKMYVEHSANGQEEKEYSFDQVLWTANLLNLAPNLDIKVDYSKMDKPLSTVVCNYLVREKPNLADLYHCFSIDPSVDIFRITNYSNYCPGACRGDAYPLTVEMLLDDQKFSNGNFADKGLEDLIKMKVITSSAEVVFKAEELLKYGFPRPSIANFEEICRVRDIIRRDYSDVIQLFGILAKDQIFFMKDIFLDAYNFVESLRS